MDRRAFIIGAASAAAVACSRATTSPQSGATPGKGVVAVVVPAQAVTAWMQREPDAWAKVVEWFGANGKAIVQV
jgi:hypothetical protein